MKFIQNKKYSILSNILKYSFVFLIAVTLVMPFIVNAKVGDPAGGMQGKDPGQAAGEMQGKDKITGIDFKIKNPINVETIPQFIEIVLNAVLVMGIPIVALAIIYCGFLFVKARGNGEEIKKAKAAFMYTIVGAFLLLGAWVLAKAIGSTVKEIIETT
jgi:hypothetical protein